MVPRALFLILAGIAVAAFGAAEKPVDKKMLSERLTAYRDIRRLTAHFHETKHIADLKVALKSEGELTLERPSRVIWKVLTPSPLTVRLEAGKLSLSGTDGKEEAVTLDDRARDSLKALVAWLELDPQGLLAAYRITDLGSGRYRFEPRGESGPVRSLEATLKSGSYVEELKIEEKSGDRIEIRFDRPRIERARGK